MSPAPMPCALSACTSWWARPARSPKVSVTPDGDATTAGRSGWSSATHQTPRRWLQGFSTSKEYTLLWLGAGALRAPGLGVAQDLAKRLVAVDARLAGEAEKALAADVALDPVAAAGERHSWEACRVGKVGVTTCRSRW